MGNAITKEMICMSENEKNEIADISKKFGVEFSNEFNIGLDYNANLHQSAKDEISKVKEFHESRL